MITLIDNGDTVAAFDWATSEIVVTVVGHEVARFKVNRLFLAYHKKVAPILGPGAQTQMALDLHDDPEPSNGQLFVPLLDGFGRRLLGQRDKARDAGDRLAADVLELFQRRPDPDRVLAALRQYAKSEGWGGPAMSWIRKALLEE